MRRYSVRFFVVAAAVVTMSIPVGLIPAERAAASGTCFNPARVSWPKWMRADLPLPDGSYAFRHLKKYRGYHRAYFFVPRNANGFGRWVLNRWPDEGWTLGRGDAEPGETENNFRKGSAIGAFKDNTRCRAKKSKLYLILNPNG